MTQRMKHLVVSGSCLVLVTVLLPAVIEARSLRLNARSAILVDAADGRILFEQTADTPIQPASVTKVLSLYLVFDALRQGRVHLWDKVTISTRAARTGGSKMFLKAGQQVTLEELIKGMAVFSGNDASVAVAEYLGGNVGNFVRMMNVKAQELGMRNSRFLNPNGLPAKGQVTTARDMARLCMAYIKHHPESFRLHSLRSFTFNKVTQANRNRLLGKCQGVDGIKTGFVCAAGYHLAVTAQRGNTRLIAVLMGAPKPSIRTKESARLIEEGFYRVAMNEPAGATSLWAKAPVQTTPKRSADARLVRQTIPKADLQDPVKSVPGHKQTLAKRPQAKLQKSTVRHKTAKPRKPTTSSKQVVTRATGKSKTAATRKNASTKMAALPKSSKSTKPKTVVSNSKTSRQASTVKRNPPAVKNTSRAKPSAVKERPPARDSKAVAQKDSAQTSKQLQSAKDGGVRGGQGKPTDRKSQNTVRRFKIPQRTEGT